MKLKDSNVDVTKNSNCDESKNSNCDETSMKICFFVVELGSHTLGF